MNLTKNLALELVEELFCNIAYRYLDPYMGIDQQPYDKVVYQESTNRLKQRVRELSLLPTRTRLPMATMSQGMLHTRRQENCEAASVMPRSVRLAEAEARLGLP